MICQTRHIIMPGGRMLITMMYLYAFPFIGILMLMILGAALAGIIYDIRWAIVSLMILFIVAPFLMSYLYFFHGLRPLTASNKANHTISFEDDAFTLSIFGKKEDDAGYEDREDKEPEPSGREEETADNHLKSEEWIIRHQFTVPYSLKDRLIAGSDGYIILFRTPHKGFLWLPYDSFNHPEDMRNVIKKFEKL